MVTPPHGLSEKFRGVKFLREAVTFFLRGRETFTSGRYFFTRGREIFTSGLYVFGFGRETLAEGVGATIGAGIGAGIGATTWHCNCLIIRVGVRGVTNFRHFG